LIRSLVRNVALLATLGLALAASTAQAGFSGSFSVTGLSTTSSTGGLAGAPTFTFTGFAGFGAFLVTSNGTGGFSSIVAGDSFAPTTFSPASPTGSFSFTSTTLGTFTTTAPFGPSVLGYDSKGNVTSLTINLIGDYSGGAVGATAVPAQFTLSFTQAGGPGNSISSSGSLVIPPPSPPAVPEPASIAMLGLGLGFVGLGVRRSTRKVS
jgi:hypothetical protein